jgi:hypothetical protein
MTNISSTTAVPSELSLKVEGSTQLMWGTDLNLALLTAGRIQSMFSVANFFEKSSQLAGDYVRILPELKFMPVLPDNRGDVVFLYEVIEAIDGLVDYGKLNAQFPTLTISQLDGTIAFLRKLMQFNANGLDVDELEDIQIASDTDLVSDLKKAFQDTQIKRVLHHD